MLAAVRTLSGMTKRVSPRVELTLPPTVVAVLDALVAEDCAATGRDPSRERSSTVATLVLAEQKRRATRAARKET